MMVNNMDSIWWLVIKLQNAYVVLQQLQLNYVIKRRF